MRKVAAIYDIHGNLPALEAVLGEIEREHVDCIIVGGDVAWGPDPVGVLHRLMSLPGDVRFVRGNTDRYVAERYGVENGLDPWDAEINKWCADQIDDGQRTFLKNLPDSVSLEIYGLGPTLFVHGSPRRDNEAIRRDTPESELGPMLEGVVEGLVVCGHTHVQFDRTACGKRIVNPGSVGLQIRARGACWALFGPDVDLRQTMYDFEEAAKRIRQTGVPMAEEFAQHILMPPMKES